MISGVADTVDNPAVSVAANIAIVSIVVRCMLLNSSPLQLTCIQI